MAFLKIIGMFDDLALLRRAKDELISAGLATEATMSVEPEELIQDLHPPRPATVWERLKELIGGESHDQAGIYAEGIRRGSFVLVVTAPEEKVEQIKEVLRRNGVVNIGRRVRRWIDAGWKGFDPAALAFTEEEIIDEQRACIDANAIATAQEDDRHAPERNVRLFDEATGREIGRISENELAVLQAAFEEEGPDDSDYWVNSDEIDDLACRPGATPHLIALLRAAVGDRPDGIDIAFQREEQARESFRAGASKRERAGKETRL